MKIEQIELMSSHYLNDYRVHNAMIDVCKEYNVNKDWLEKPVYGLSYKDKTMLLHADAMRPNMLVSYLENLTSVNYCPFTQQELIELTPFIYKNLDRLGFTLFAPRPLRLAGTILPDNKLLYTANHLAVMSDNYLQSLTHDQRYKYKKALQSLESIESTSTSTLDLNEVYDLIDSKRPINNDYDNVGANIFKAHILSRVCSDYYKVTNIHLYEDKLLAVGSWLEEEANRLNFNSFASDDTSNIGGMWMVKSIETFKHLPVTLNMTTASNFGSFSYDRYKKRVANQTEIVGCTSTSLTLDDGYGAPCYTNVDNTPQWLS